jgi:hypothetical protein
LARQIDFPLHPQTVNAVQVGALLETLLAAISREIKLHGQVSDGDVLQSLCMALAIRMYMVEAPIGAVQQLVAGLLDQADDAVAGSAVQPVGKA